ncbi:MAG TPA: cobalamin biosynthesis protein [Coriobacteriia bacterium]|nr:cobalamin biosynthesis protein [Coriobacteriia bacterium]
MLAFVFGGCRSGKSGFAEQLLQGYAGSCELGYVATMWPAGDDAKARIERHRMLRADKGFTSYERYFDVGGLELPANSAVMLECLSTLVANEMFQPGGAGGDTFKVTLDGIRRLASRTTHLIVVSSNLTSDGVCYDASTQEYQRTLAALMGEITALSDTVIEMVCGIPIHLKGAAACRSSVA